jgi:hypothetical protein
MLFLQIQALQWAGPPTLCPTDSHILCDVKKVYRICIITIFWDAAPCRLLVGYQCSEGVCSFHNLERRVPKSPQALAAHLQNCKASHLTRFHFKHSPLWELRALLKTATTTTTTILIKIYTKQKRNSVTCSPQANYLYIGVKSVWVRNLVSDIKEGTLTEGVWEQGVEENIWTEERW